VPTLECGRNTASRTSEVSINRGRLLKFCAVSMERMWRVLSALRGIRIRVSRKDCKACVGLKVSSRLAVANSGPRAQLLDVIDGEA